MSSSSSSSSSNSSASIPIISLDDPETIKSGKLAQAFAEFGCCYLAGALRFPFSLVEPLLPD